MSYKLDERSKLLLIVLAVLAILTLGIHLTRSQMMASAQELVNNTTSRINGVSQQLTESDQAITSAKKVHLTKYTKDLSTTKEKAALSRAKSLRDEANKANDPDKKRDLAAQASQALSQAEIGLKNYRDYLSLLDKAKQNYGSEPDKLLGQIEETDNYIAGLVKEGYFQNHFNQAKKGLSEARVSRDKAIALSKQVVESNQPDYLQVYQICLTAEQVTASSRKLASSVPETRKANEQAIARLKNGVSTLKMSYNDALVAAVSLERYAPYRVLNKVEAANKQLDPIFGRLQSAQSQNSMQVQEFFGASESLNGIDRQLSEIDQLFNQSVQNWNRVSAALNQIPGAESAAQSAISRAISHKNSYSENSQYRAESLLSQARSELDSANSLRTVDPPQSLNHYEEAEDYADQAYSAVDTSDHDSSSSTNYYGGSSSSGSSGGGTIGGGSSSNYSGGYSSPSGGGAGGPSGGGAGYGGF